jgi:hypothetical protein
MDESRLGAQVAAETLLQPTATRKHLDSVWIGIGLALDWIAMRGQPMPEQDYNARHDEAASALVDLLANMPPAIAEAVVRGAAEGHLEELKPIPSGIWRQTAANVYNEASRPYRLIGGIHTPRAALREGLFWRSAFHARLTGNGCRQRCWRVFYGRWDLCPPPPLER